MVNFVNSFINPFRNKSYVTKTTAISFWTNDVEIKYFGQKELGINLIEVS